MTIKSLVIAGLLSGVAVAAAPAQAAVIVVPLGVIVVPPTQTFAPGVTFVTSGPDQGADFQFFISQPMTLTVSSFTNSSIGGTGVFTFTSIALYSGFTTAGVPLQVGSVSVDGNTNRASLNQFSLNQGPYTIAYRGTVTGPPAGVGSNITFAAGAVPEPATWGLMIAGFGAAGGVLRMRKRQTVRVAYA